MWRWGQPLSAQMTTRGKPRTCIFCGAMGKLTRDHVPPKGLFPSPAPDDLVTVPACRECNRTSSGDEEYFRIFACGKAPQTPAALRTWDEKVVGSTLPRSPKLRRGIIQGIRSVEVRTAAGLYLGRVPVLTFEGRRIARVLEKTVRGLYWHRTKQRVPPDAQFVCPKESIQDADFLDILRTVPKWTVGDGSIFRYAFAVEGDDPRYQVWWLLFYANHVLQVVVKPKSRTTQAAPLDGS